MTTSPRTLLIADDDARMVRLITEHLLHADMQWRILRASNGREAVEVAQQEVPDVILTDWDMPVLNGIDAIRQIRKHEATSHIPVIMATGEMLTSEDLRIALEAGAWDYLRKPIDLVEMDARLKSALRLRQQQQQIEQLLKQDIDLKNRQLSTTSMLMVEKSSLLQGLYEELSNLVNEQPELAPKLSKLQRRLTNHLEADESWLSFRTHFEEVHPEFFTKLTNLATDLSQKDAKMCAYLKMGMDTKEIAHLLNITPASVRTSVYRIKKRMNLPEEDTLRDFLTRFE